MAAVYDFSYYRARRLVKDRMKDKGLIYEVYLSTVQFVYENLWRNHQDGMEFLTTHSDLRELFKGDEQKFAATFMLINKYWELEPVVCQGMFDQFQTIGDVCHYIEKKVKTM